MVFNEEDDDAPPPETPEEDKNAKPRLRIVK
jgi:hypothetical protein